MEARRGSVKQITKAKKEPKAKKPKAKNARNELKDIEETAAFGACILQMFCTLETQAMNKTRQDLAEFRLLLADTSREQIGCTKPTYLEKLPDAISKAWNSFRAGEPEKAKLVFLDELSTSPVPPVPLIIISKPDSVKTPPPQIQDDQYDSGIEVDMIDSPSLYMLPNQDYLNETVTIKAEAIPSTSHSPSN